MSTNGSRLSTMQLASMLAAAVGIVQLLLGGMLISQPGDLNTVHLIVGYLAMLSTAFAAWATFQWKKCGGNPGLFPHALGMFVVAVVQFGLGEMLDGTDLRRNIHIVLGIIYLLGVGGLATLAFRKPHAA